MAVKEPTFPRLDKRKWAKRLLACLMLPLLMAQCSGCVVTYLVMEDVMEKAAEPQPAPPPTQTLKPEPYPAEWPAPFTTLAESRYVVNLLSEKNYENAMAIYGGVMGFESSISLPHPMAGPELAELIRILVLDCPELFQCTSANIFEAQYYKENEKICRVDPIYQYSKDAYEGRRRAQDEAAASILSGAQGMSLYEAALYCHDTLLNNCEYLKQPDAGTTTAYGALVGGKAQCYGYTLALLQLLRGLGVPCFCLTGHALDEKTGEYTVPHHWVAAWLDGAWYSIDPTHDDLSEGRLYHANFCVSDQELFSIRDETFYGDLVALPACTGGNQNYYSKTDALIGPEEDAGAAFGRIVSYAAATGQTGTEMRFTDVLQYEQMKEDLKSGQAMAEVRERLAAYGLGYRTYAFDRRRVILVRFAAKGE